MFGNEPDNPAGAEVISFFDGQPLDPEVVEVEAELQAQTFNPGAFVLDGGGLEVVGTGPINASEFETMEPDEVHQILGAGEKSPSDKNPY